VFIDGFSSLEKMALELEEVLPKKEDRKKVGGDKKVEGDKDEDNKEDGEVDNKVTDESIDESIEGIKARLK